jgi:hypothetical protein
MAEVTQATVDRVHQKLQQLYDSLSHDEQAVLQSILDQARKGAEVGGFMRQDMLRFRMIPADRTSMPRPLGLMVK